MSKTPIKTSKNSYAKTTMKKDNLYISNLDLCRIVTILDNEQDTNKDIQEIIISIVVTGVILMVMAQIAISARPESMEYVDKLPSYKDVKKKFVTSVIGKTVAASVGVVLALPYILMDKSLVNEPNQDILLQLVNDLASSSTPNTRRLKPSVAEWPKYAKGEMISAMGQMISCPGTNLKLLNIDGTIVLDYGLNDAIKAIGITDALLSKHKVTSELIKCSIEKVFLVDNCGIPIESVIYNEPIGIQSKIQNEILGEKVIRTNDLGINLQLDLKTDVVLTKDQVKKHLTSLQFQGYEIAVRLGDKNILSKYMEIVREKSK